MIAVGLGLLGLAALTGYCAPLPGGAGSRLLPVIAWTSNLVAAVVWLVAGAGGLAGRTQALKLGMLGGLGPGSLTVDRLSGLFLVISFAVAVPALGAAAATGNQVRHRLPAALAALMAAVAVIVTADNFFVLLFGWEALTAVFYLLAGYDRALPGRASGSVATVVFGKASGAALLAGALLLASHTHTFQFTIDSANPHSVFSQTAYGLLLLGFGIKVGLVPAHVWMPRGYACAPGPARALMAGFAVNVGFYGMWRTLHVLGAPPVWLSCVVLVIGGLTGILGIAQAAVNPDLAVLVSWSSVENAGIITAGFGAALMGATVGNSPLIAAGLIAATAQVIAHALGKTLLFVSVSAIERATGTTDLDRLGAVVRRIPWAGTGLVVGCLTLAGLPLTAGFASEWFTLEALMQQFRVSNLPMQLCAASAGALIALTIGVAGVTFVRVVALTAFGPARIEEPPIAAWPARLDHQWPHRLAITALVVGCLGAAAAAPLEVRMIGGGIRPIVGNDAAGANSQPWVVQPVFKEFSALSPSWLWIVIPTLSLTIFVAAAVLARRNPLRVRIVAPWSSASPGVDRGVGYTSFAYANPLRNVLSTILLTRTEFVEANHTVRNAPSGCDTTKPVTFVYRVHIVDVVERFFYRPATAALLVSSRWAKRLQSGRLDAYMAYMLVAVLAVLSVVIATST